LVYLIFAVVISYKVLSTERLSYEEIWEFDKHLNDLDDRLLELPYSSLFMEGDKNIKLHARLFEAPVKTHKYILLNHGNSCVYTGMLKYISVLRELGINVLAPDHRGRGESGGALNSFGYYEYRDSLKWLDKLFELDPAAQVAVMGESMGGAISLMMGAQDDRIKLVIEDCGFYNAYDSVRFILIKKLGRLLGEMLMPLVNLFLYLASGARLRRMDAAHAAAKMSMPLLVIHGREDTKVPVYNAFIIHKANPSGELEIFERAEHANCIGSERDRYIN